MRIILCCTDVVHYIHSIINHCQVTKGIEATGRVPRGFVPQPVCWGRCDEPSRRLPLAFRGCVTISRDAACLVICYVRRTTNGFIRHVTQTYKPHSTELLDADQILASQRDSEPHRGEKRRIGITYLLFRNNHNFIRQCIIFLPARIFILQFKHLHGLSIIQI